MIASGENAVRRPSQTMSRIGGDSWFSRGTASSVEVFTLRLDRTAPEPTRGKSALARGLAVDGHRIDAHGPAVESASFASRSLRTEPPWLPCPTLPRPGAARTADVRRGSRAIPARFDISLQFAELVVPLAGQARALGACRCSERPMPRASIVKPSCRGVRTVRQTDLGHLGVAEIAEELHRPVKIIGLNHFDVLGRRARRSITLSAEARTSSTASTAMKVRVLAMANWKENADEIQIGNQRGFDAIDSGGKPNGRPLRSLKGLKWRRSSVKILEIRSRWAR